MEAVDYKKKIKLCEKLGANKFQKVVFKVEELKYKFIKKFIPKYIEWYDKICDRKRKKELKKAKTPEERKYIVEHYRRQKMLMRKEFHREQNRNYHMDPNKPTEILEYLKWNKDIHMRGIIKNAIAIPCLAVATGFGLWPSVVLPFLALEVGSLFINFQCVNIQNCNIYRYKKHEELLRKKHERQMKKNIERYSEGAEALEKTYQKTNEIPTTKDITDNIDSLEELRELRILIHDTKEANKVVASQKKIGGK